MNFEDFLIAPRKIKTEKWQIGHKIYDEIRENGIALVFVSDERGAGRNAETHDFSRLRKIFYRLSALDFEVPVSDLGDLVSGKTQEDTQYILQEILSGCHYKGSIPVVIGGSADLAFAEFAALNFHHKNLTYTQIANAISLANESGEITEKNYLSRIFGGKNFTLKNFHLLGYQKHLNEMDSVKMVKDVDFDIIRLAEMMGSTERTEPFFRRADMVTVNCDAVESFADAFSIHPQVNGLNRREICAFMKEAGLSENLKSAGIFNYNFVNDNLLNDQLLAQMIWYLIEGINIRRTHPKDKQYETFYVMIGEENYAFRRETFSNLWYFGEDENIENCIPCAREDFDLAKKGSLNERFLR